MRSVVFLHGLACGSRMWAPQLASFAAQGFAPIALDLPGYGERAPIEQMDLDMLAADVEAAIEARRIERPALVGHSLGARVIQLMLRRRAERYVAAVLACTIPAFRGPSGALTDRFISALLGPLAAGGSMADLGRRAAETLVGPAADRATRIRVAETVAATPDATYRTAVSCLGAAEDGPVPTTRTPVLCLAGEHDRNVPPAVMERLAARIPGAGYICLAGLGHFPNLEAPGAFDAAVCGFLQALEDEAPRR